MRNRILPLHINILPLEKSVTTVVSGIPAFGDKHYVERFYKTVDDHLPKMAAAGKKNPLTVVISKGATK